MAVSEEIVLYTNPMSRGRIARIMLEELGRPYRAEALEYGADMKAPEYLAINPMGKVPALTHRAQVISETAAICAYLADAFPEAGLAPEPASPLRAPYYRWLFFAAGPLEAAVTAKALGLLAPPEKAAMAGYGSFEAVIDGLEHALKPGPWILGDRFSAADVYLGAQVSWGLMFKTLPARPALTDYAARLEGRPAWKRAARKDDALKPTPD